MKKVLISPKVFSNPNYHELNNILDFEYINFFENLGYLPVIIPNNSKNIESFFKLDNVELVVLSGGNNVNPNLYGSSDDLGDVFNVRDNAESKIIEESIKRDIPLFGICRGFHMINVYFRGSLTHGISNHVRKDHKLISDNSILNDVVTNTYHNQGILDEDLASELDIIAKTEDGFIECFKHKQYKILGVQWHPERQSNKYDNDLICSFLRGEV